MGAVSMMAAAWPYLVRVGVGVGVGVRVRVRVRVRVQSSGLRAQG